jgi:uncharacterized membrane protein YjjP (DUF1212 family)
VPDDKNSGPTADDGLHVLLCFSALLLQAGCTAARTRELMEGMARKFGFDAVSVATTIEGVTASVRCAGVWTTAMREIKPPGINTSRVHELERLARTVEAEPRGIATRLGEIESLPPRFSHAQIAAAIAVASAGFAFLNGAAAPEMIAAGLGGGIGQALRAQLSRRQFNHFAVAAVSAVAASGTYLVASLLGARFGFAFPHPAGFISSVLFLVPGFPLIAGQFDLLHHQTIAAVSRLAYGIMVLLAVAFGLSIVIAVGRIDLSPEPPLDIAYSLKLLLRAVASFVAASAFAMLFNGSVRTVLAAGILGLGANELRLILLDAGMMPAPAAFFGALAVGVAASAMDRYWHLPRIVTTVPPIIIMVPGLYAYEMIVLFNRGQMIEALQASASCGFVIGALAMGLATVRFFNRR